MAEATAGLAPGDWVLVGWGDATFYVDQSPISGRLADGARAFFRPGNASVVMLDPEARDPARLFRPEDRQALRLSSAGMAALRARIAASLALDAAGRPILAAARTGDDARFFLGWCADAVGDHDERDRALTAYLAHAPAGRHAAAAAALLHRP